MLTICYESLPIIFEDVSLFDCHEYDGFLHLLGASLFLHSEDDLLCLFTLVVISVVLSGPFIGITLLGPILFIAIMITLSFVASIVVVPIFVVPAVLEHVPVLVALVAFGLANMSAVFKGMIPLFAVFAKEVCGSTYFGAAILSVRSIIGFVQYHVHVHAMVVSFLASDILLFEESNEFLRGDLVFRIFIDSTCSPLLQLCRVV